MARDLTLAARLSLDNRRYVQGLAGAQSRTRTFAGAVKREMGELRNFLGGTASQLAALGGGFALGMQIRQSAELDKTLTQIGQTAGASEDQVKGLRGELFAMSQSTGRATDDLTQGFNVLVQSGLQWDESRATLQAINKTMAVTGANADTLAGSLGVASTAFQFDLSQPQLALGLLDKMTVAGRLGNAELENLGSIFSRVGVNAKGAGFGFEQTLAFIEGLSMIERQPERLATLADSTMRLFTNARYMAAAQKASGVRFFDKATGERRDPLVILAELKKRMDAMKTEAQREGFLAKAFQGADLDTIKGLRTLLQGNSLTKINEFTKQITDASGTIEKDLPQAISNAVDQTGRLKARLVEAADAFARPINEVYTKLVSRALKPEDEGGLSNTELIGGGVGVLAGGYVIKRLLGGLVGRILGGAGSLAGGVAMGTALEKAGAATPVFVVGAAPGIFGGLGGVGTAAGSAGAAATGAAAASAGRKLGTRALLARTGVVAAGAVGVPAIAIGGAGLLGYGAGSKVYDAVGRTSYGARANEALGQRIAEALALFGNAEAQRALARDKQNKLQAEMDIRVYDHRIGVSVRGKDFQNVRSRVNGKSARTGRRTAGGGR